MDALGSLVHWKASNALHSDASSSTLSFSGGGMDDFPFSLEDLPPEIRNKIDDIIEKNENLESQLEAIDELLFADRPLAKFDIGTKFDIGSESGIGSDSDSGNGILPSTDPLTNSSTSSNFSRPADEDIVINPRTFGPLRRSPIPPAQNDDDFITRLIVPPPPLPNSYSNSETKDKCTLRIPRSPSSSLLHHQHNSSSKTVANDAIPLALPPPLGFGAISGKDLREVEHDSSDEKIKVVRTGDNFCVTLDVPHSSWSTPTPSPSEERSFNVSRILVTTDESKDMSGPIATRILKDNERPPQNVTTELSSLKSNPRSKTVSLSRSSSRSELYAWEDVPKCSISPQSTIRSSKPSSSEKSLSLTGFDVGETEVRRPSQLSLESSRKMKMFWKKDETDTEPVSKYISTPSRYSKGLTGPRKWRPISEFLSKGKAETDITKGGVEGRADTSDNERNDLEGIKEEKKETASDDDFSSLVQLRGKNGKPAQMVRIDHRTPKAQSMLSLYDASSDATEKSKGKKKSNREETGNASDSKKRLSSLFHEKLKFHKKPKDGKFKQSNERTNSANGVISKVYSGAELHRSDYLHSAPSFVPTRCSIPSPSLYSSIDNNINSSLKLRSLSGPGHISDIYRINARDLSVDDDRPPLTFDTFRGQIEPIRWREENTDFSRNNRWTHASTTESPLSSVELASRSSLPVNASRLEATNGRESAHEGASNCLHRPNDHRLKTAHNLYNERSEENRSITDGGQSSSSCVLIVNGLPATTTPVIKVTTSPVSKIIPSQSYPARLFTASDEDPVIQKTSIDDASSRIFANGLSDSMMRNNSTASGLQSEFRSANHDLLGSRTSGHHGGNSRNHVTMNSLPKNGTNGNSSCNEKQRVLQTTYDDATGCDRAVLEIRQMMSSLLADREWILSATHSTSGPSFALYRTRKDSLGANCRHLVTDAKLMVAGATRSRQDLINSLTTVLHTFASVFESCRLVVTALPLDNRREILLDEVLKVGDVFLNTLSSANVAAGKRQSDPAMGQLMCHTTELAHSLGRLVDTIKRLDNYT